MKDAHPDTLRELVDRVARSVTPRQPPLTLSVRPPRRVRRWASRTAIAVLALVVLVAGGQFITRQPREQVSATAGERVVIERLRIGGRPATSRMAEPPGVDAVLVLADSVDAISGVATAPVRR